jgi:hypothetical protein
VKQRPTSGECADVYVDGKKKSVVGAHLVFAFRSFLMKAECGEAGLNSLILRQQQNKNSRAYIAENGLQALRTGPSNTFKMAPAVAAYPR